MKELVDKSEGFARVEFWASITLFVFVVFFFIAEGIDPAPHVESPNQSFFEEAGLAFQYYRHYFFPQLLRHLILFLAYLVLNFTVVPSLLRGEALVRNVLVIVITFLAGGVLLGITDTHLKNYLFSRYATEQETYLRIFRSSFLYAFWLLMTLGLYSLIKYAGVYILSRSAAIQKKYPFVTFESLVALVLWMIGLFLLLLSSVNGDQPEILSVWIVLIPCGLALYWYSFASLIPGSLLRKRSFLLYLVKVAGLLLVSYLPVALLVMNFVQRGDAGFDLSLFNSFFQLFITAPFSWVLFKRRLKGNEELYSLRQKLGQSAANLDFLRSQINPHFLFNALNTIYGTAIQEKAERTSEAVEKLGDMMRFMLQENVQEKIALVREIEYLNNYIGLQKLRTDPTPGVNIQTQIAQPASPVQIAPMLLIPFVENAFKHGISLREPSHIILSLELRNQTLYFDIHNSRHLRPANDPERYKSGIGLANVRQRLQQLYAGKYELIIRETAKEYFVHLTLQLN